jgi:hypothetical protein
MVELLDASAAEYRPPSRNGDVGDLDDIRRAARDCALHPESLLNIPLVRRVFCDLNFRLVERAVDSQWSYAKICPIWVTGFNPFERSYFYGTRSHFKDWLGDPAGSPRAFNEGDFLVKEVLFMVHDYLHAWAYLTIEDLRPELHVLDAPITAECLDDLTFCHLLTEAAAVVGLDYWMLCCVRLNDFCPIGTLLGPQTVSYQEAHLPEFRRFNPSFTVQTPEFFDTIASFYATGEFPGFDVSDLQRSPQLLSWLRHELTYGSSQREVTRRWLAYLSKDAIALDPKRLKAPLAIDAPWKQQLMSELGARLWDFVKSGKETPVTALPVAADRKASTAKPRDWRFTNLSVSSFQEVDPAALTADPDSFKYFFGQVLCSVPFETLPAPLVKMIPLMLRERNAELVMHIFRNVDKLAVGAYEPRDLLVVN